ncbi:MAG: cupin domain-containing protein [Acidimicrobiia bacterium]
MRRPIRRVVTGFDEHGASIVTLDGATPIDIESLNGGPEVTFVWATPDVAVLPAPSADPIVGLVDAFPRPGGSSVMIVTHPPGSGVTGGDGMDGDLAGDVTVDLDGLHATETVDYIIVISGEIWLELDNKAEVKLGPGDVLVQNGTRHGWRNRGTQDATVAVVLLGARRAT